MDEVLNYIANLGFPIVISVYLLTRIEQKLSELTESIRSLTLAIKSNEIAI